MIYRVLPGDCLSSIAHRHGFANWKVLYDLPQNAGLRQSRKHPNVLLPGDEVYVPDPTPTPFQRSTDSRHTFVVRRERTRLRVRVRNIDGRAHGQARYVLDIDGKQVSGTLGAEGLIEHEVAFSTTKAQLTVIVGTAPEERSYEWDLHLGHLDPVDEEPGIKGRMANLALDPDASGAGNADERFEYLLRVFQWHQDLELTGRLDDATRARIEEHHDGAA